MIANQALAKTSVLVEYGKCMFSVVVNIRLCWMRALLIRCALHRTKATKAISTPHAVSVLILKTLGVLKIPTLRYAYIYA